VKCAPRHSLQLTILMAVWAAAPHAAVVRALAPPVSLPPDTLLRGEHISQAGFSPDGRWLAVLVSRYGDSDGSVRPTNMVTSSLRIIHLGSGRVYEPAPPRSQTTTFAWAPRRGVLAFDVVSEGSRALWQWRTDGSSSRPLADLSLAAGNFGWTPRGDTLIVPTKPLSTDQEDRSSSEVPDASPPEASKKTEVSSNPRPTVTIYRSASAVPTLMPAFASKDPLRGDWVLLSPSNGSFVRLVDGVRAQSIHISPNGRWLAYASLMGQREGSGFRNVFGLFIVPMDASAPPRPLIPDIESVRTVFDFSWAPNSRGIAYITSELRSAADSGEPNLAPLGAGASESRIANRTRDNDCYIVDLEGHRRRVRLIERGNDLGFSVSPYRTPIWSRDGRQLYLLGSRGVWRADAAVARARLLASITGKKILQIVAAHTSDTLGTGLERKGLLVIARDELTADEGIYRVDLTSGRATALLERHASLSSSPSKLDLSTDQRALLFPSESADSPEQLWILDPQSLSARQISHFNSELSAFEFGSSRLIGWRDAAGRELRGALILPVRYRAGSRYPLIVDVYPNEPLSEAVNQFGGYGGWSNPLYNAQLLTTRGFAVLEADSYAHAPTRMQDIASSVLPGVDKVVELGVGDPQRIGVRGQSDGGYSALALLVLSDRFKAAMISGGFANLSSLYGQMHADGTHWTRSWLERADIMAGAPWEYRDRYVGNSPLFYLDRVKTPLLILHGVDDTAVSVTQADEVYMALDRLGKNVLYARYQNEGHLILHRPDFIDAADRMTKWFATNLSAESSFEAQ
jgi:dipeptidyl aminopeptidase/acylaminoacyl peptidase